MTEVWVREKVHKLYWEDDINCAGTMLRCLSEAFDVKLDRQVLSAAAGMRGAGGYGAQCGLVEGALLFIGIYCGLTGAGCEKAADYCCEYAKAFENKFGSLRCHDLRPGGFTEQDPLHLCEKITCEAVLFACGFVRERMECQKEEQLYRTDTGEVILRMAGREEMQALTEIRMAYLWDEHGHLEQEMEDMMRRQLSGYFERHLGRDFHAFVAVDAHGAMTASAFLLVTERPAKPDCISGKNGTVLNVYTKPACRRQGIAGRLIEMLLKKAEDMGMDYVDLKATGEGYGLYKKMGFEDGKSDYFDMRYWIGQGNTDG